MSDTEFKLKPNVAAILRNARGQILICERIGVAGAWQFPQGGIDDGEMPEEALRRELREEIGVAPKAYTIVESRGPYRYVFGEGVKKRGHHGKVQTYFLCDFHADDSAINVRTEHPEFRAFRWIAPTDFQLAWLPPMKREVYAAVFLDFFGHKFPASA